MKEVVMGVEEGVLQESDISDQLLERCLYTNHSSNPDLLIRTSGEVRLSDFLLWQSTFSVLSFLEVLWPDFSIWHLYAAIIHYQRNYDAVMAKANNLQNRERLLQESDKKCVLQEMKKCSDCENDKVHHEDLDLCSLRDKVIEYAKKRKHREDLFVNKLNEKRDLFLASKLAPVK
ncbi:hypothetical protein DPMN_044968 [Dreissena polymorpha]|uniref:ditrans,polycis-polyprenyl diphosphate synthase [(2E,6E)-farnesyldiphosphate specific] n=1 Tax=Dreissena polymorpha TaxID=45954 RepID=A0A9D4D5H5_DREPO|nr:hypothetical protein DPMN_044968 [Dreissena polymorpha]